MTDIDWKHGSESWVCSNCFNVLVPIEGDMCLGCETMVAEVDALKAEVEMYRVDSEFQRGLQNGWKEKYNDVVRGFADKAREREAEIERLKKHYCESTPYCSHVGGE